MPSIEGLRLKFRNKIYIPLTCKKRSTYLKTKDFTLDGVRYIVEDDGVITDEYDSDDENWEDYQSGSSTSSSGGGPSSEATGSTDDSYKKPEYTSYPKESPDSSYRQSSVKDSDISEDE